ncbi:ribosomal protein L11 [Lentinula raphanica]|nr:ribosomal protein L11 [Lentinula raphanica]
MLFNNRQMSKDAAVTRPGDRLTRASKVLEQLTGQIPVTPRARYTVRTFGVRRNEKITVHVTIRWPKAKDLDRALKVKEYELRRRNFSQTETLVSVSKNTVDLGFHCDPGIDIIGMDFYVIVGRPGARSARRKQKKER